MDGVGQIVAMTSFSEAKRELCTIQDVGCCMRRDEHSRGEAHLLCLQVCCPPSGWPMIPTNAQIMLTLTDQ